MSTPVMVFVPGTLGSELEDEEGTVWPGSLFEAISGFNEKKFARLKKAGLKAPRIVLSAAGGLVPIYKPWIDAFSAIQLDNGHRPFREKPDAGDPATLRSFPYDWRLDLIETSTQLAHFLEAVLTEIPDADIKLVCHSQGGLLARYYLESGGFKDKPAFKRVSLFATFGTPHNGAPIAYAAAIGEHKTDFLSKAQTKELASDSLCPSLYQLFPAKSHLFLWNMSGRASEGRPMDPDDPTLVARYGLSEANLKKWRDFRAGLTDNRREDVRYFYVIGSRQQTLTRMSWDGSDLNLQEIEDAGDGTVSLLGSVHVGTQCEFVGKSHVSLIGTREARETIATLFGGRIPLATRTFELSLRKLVVTTDETIHVQIECLEPLNHLQATLRFERADIPDPAHPPTGALSFVASTSMPLIPIDVSSVGLEILNLQTAPITTRGLYRPILEVAGPEGSLTTGPTFVVQQENAP